MKKLPTIQTARLILRPFTLDDVSPIALLANNRDVAKNTLNLPHPYDEYMARSWINNHESLYDEGSLLNLAVTLRKTNKVIGAIGFDLDFKNNNAEIGYWIGQPFWGQGYATEAAKRLLHYGFTELKFHRIHCCHLTSTPTAKRVIEKLGMKHEGTLREHLKIFDVYETVEKYGLLRDEYLALQK